MLITMKSLRATYDGIALEWSKRRPAEWMQKSIDKFISFLKVGDTVLDVGCGSGDQTTYLIEKGLKVKGIDFSDEMIKNCRREVPRGEFVLMNLEDIDMLEEKSDGIFARAVLLHFPKKKIPEILFKMKNLLKGNGYIYIAVKEKREGEGEEEIVRENEYGIEIERFFSYFTLDELEGILNNTGFEICYKEISVATGGTRKWIQIVAKKK